MRVLVVDDEEMIRDMCTSALEAAGMTSAEAEDGPSALGILGGETFDAVLLDMAFRGQRVGRELYRTILDKHPGLEGRIIIITGVLKGDELEAFRSEGVAVLEKPFELDEMISTVRNIGPRS
jgi:CheY-like chemotaxis protein